MAGLRLMSNINMKQNYVDATEIEKIFTFNFI